MDKKICSCCGKVIPAGSVCISINKDFNLCLSCHEKVEKVSELMGISEQEEEKKKASYVPCIVSEPGLTPKKIKQKLDEYVVGQEEAKQLLAVASYNHYKRIQLNDPEIQKSNVLLIGPTGCGKTHLVKTLAKILGVAVCIAPATNLTECGYKGNDPDSVIASLYNAAGKDIEKTQHGIVFIDEVDKLVSEAGARREVGGTGVQQELLPILEGCEVQVPVSDAEAGFGTRSYVTIDTTNILFICGGAFPNLEKIMKNRRNSCSQIGFSSPLKEGKSQEDVDDVITNITTEDLKEFGLIPEFIGRLPIRARLHPLDKDILRKILTEPADSLVSQYKKLLAYDHIELLFADEALEYIAGEAEKLDTGARSLRNIMEQVLMGPMYEIPGSGIEAIYITKDYAASKDLSKLSVRRQSPQIREIEQNV